MNEPQLHDRLIRLEGVESQTGLKKSTIYKLMKEDKFPRCISVTGRMVAWSETAVQAWIRARVQGMQAQ